MFETVAFLWTAIILAYGMIALALIVGRWTLNQIGRQVFQHGGTGPAQDQPQRQSGLARGLTPGGVVQKEKPRLGA